MSDIEKQIEQVLSNNVDRVSVDFFKREFTRLQGIEKDFVVLREEHRILHDLHAATKKELSDTQQKSAQILAREAEIDKREKELTDKNTELRIETKLLEVRLSSANDRVRDHKEMFTTVFRGPVWKETYAVHESIGKVIPAVVDQNGYRQSPDYVTENHTRTTDTKREQE